MTLNRPILALLIGAFLLPACGKKKDKGDDGDGFAPPTVTSSPGHVRTPGTAGRFNVGIIDDGFDLNQPLFDGRVLADFEIICDAPKTDDKPVLGVVDADLKQAYIDAYAVSDNAGCRLSPGVTFEYSNDLKAIEDRRDPWNQGIKAKTINLNTSDAIDFRTVLGGYDKSLLYHGTNTSSLILYGNPEVRLVVIRMPLGGPSRLNLADTDSCPTQADVDAWVEVNQDPDVAKAYAAMPLGPLDQGLEDLTVQYGISLFNASYGRTPREVAEKQLADEGCGTLDLSAYYETQVAIDQKQFAARKAKLPHYSASLTVQASGNDGVVVDDGKDSLDCMPGTNTVLIGSHDIGGKRSEFSNYGACVPYLMLGEKVVVGAPREFLDVADGTSFSAPLTVRYLSMVSQPTDTAAMMLAKLDGQKNAQGFLADATFPEELAYSSPAPIADFKLTDAPGPRWAKTRADLLRSLRPLHFAKGL